MTKDEMNNYFQPATQCNRLASQFIVWKSKETNYYANGTGEASTDKYNCGLVSKKQKDILITTKYARVPLHQSYVVSVELASKWPQWDGTTDNKKITHSELIELLETL
jgi:hypothetical protein